MIQPLYVMNRSLEHALSAASLIVRDHITHIMKNE